MVEVGQDISTVLQCLYLLVLLKPSLSMLVNINFLNQKSELIMKHAKLIMERMLMATEEVMVILVVVELFILEIMLIRWVDQMDLMARDTMEVMVLMQVLLAISSLTLSSPRVEEEVARIILSVLAEVEEF